MGKTRDLLKTIRDTKGTFQARIGTVKDRNGMDLTEAEDIKKRWQEYTEELYKKDLHNLDNYDGVIAHLEPDILECEIKWALGSITMNKDSRGDRIPVELFKILKDDAVTTAPRNMPANLENSAVATGLKKVHFHSNPKERQSKGYLNYCITGLISHASKVMLLLGTLHSDGYIFPFLLCL